MITKHVYMLLGGLVGPDGIALEAEAEAEAAVKRLKARENENVDEWARRLGMDISGAND